MIGIANFSCFEGNTFDVGSGGGTVEEGAEEASKDFDDRDEKTVSVSDGKEESEFGFFGSEENFLKELMLASIHKKNSQTHYRISKIIVNNIRMSKCDSLVW